MFTSSYFVFFLQNALPKYATKKSQKMANPLIILTNSGISIFNTLIDFDSLRLTNNRPNNQNLRQEITFSPFNQSRVQFFSHQKIIRA